MQKNKGFTLVELLVVVSIVGVLMVLGMTSYNTTLKKGRDATRRGDIKSMQKAFEQYYTSNGKYGDIEAMVESIQGGLPSDPKPSPYPGYYIQVNPSTGRYCACAKLEIEGMGNSDGPPFQWGATCEFDDDGDYFCASYLQ